MRYIDADRLQTRMLNYYIDSWQLCEEINDFFANTPTADVVEVVRCKDCKHARVHDYAPAECQYYCTLAVNYHTKDFFCSLGERREDATPREE